MYKLRCQPLFVGRGELSDRGFRSECGGLELSVPCGCRRFGAIGAHAEDRSRERKAAIGQVSPCPAAGK